MVVLVGSSAPNAKMTDAPAGPRFGGAVLVRSTRAGASHRLTDHLPTRRGFSIGFDLNERVRTAGDRAGGGVHRMRWADRGGPGRPEHPIRTMRQGRDLLHLLGTDLVPHARPLRPALGTSSQIPPHVHVHRTFCRPGRRAAVVRTACFLPTTRARPRPDRSRPGRPFQREGTRVRTARLGPARHAGEAATETSSYYPLPALRPSCPGGRSCRPG